MFLMDLRRPSISRRVAKLAALGGAVLFKNHRQPFHFTSLHTTNTSISSRLRFHLPIDHDTCRHWTSCRSYCGWWWWWAVWWTSGRKVQNLPGHSNTTGPHGRTNSAREHIQQDDGRTTERILKQDQRTRHRPVTVTRLKVCCSGRSRSTPVSVRPTAGAPAR